MVRSVLALSLILLVVVGASDMISVVIRHTMVQAETPDDLRAMISERTAMIYVMAGGRTVSGPMSVAAICTIAKERGVPVFVDAAAEELTTPNVHIAAGASLVGYSGGKCLRGPQSAGLLIGDKSLCQ